MVTPMTPVDATTTWVGRRPSSVAAWRAVVCASRSPRSPVQAFAQPELQTIASIASPSVARLALVASSGAALISLVVMTSAQTCGPGSAISARSGVDAGHPDARNGSQTAANADQAYRVVRVSRRGCEHRGQAPPADRA
jgi:hypothetical protein